MQRRVAFLFLVVLATWLLPAFPARAADPLTHIPEGAFVVIRFDSVDKALGNFKDMLDGIGPVALPAAEGLTEGIGEMLDFGRESRSRLADVLEAKTPIHVALFPIFDARNAPTAVFVKPKDEAKLRRAVLGLALDDETELKVEKRDDGFEKVTREGVDRAVYFGKREEYVVYTHLEEIVKKLNEKGGKNFADVLDSRGLKLARGGDISVAVNVAPVVEKHKADIDAAREKVNETIKNLPDEALGGVGSPEKTKQIYIDLVNYAFKALHDVNWVAGNASFSSQGAKAEGFLGVKRFSLTDWVLMANPPASLENLDVLPQGSSAYYGLSMNPSLMSGMMTQAMQMSYGGELRDKDAAAKAADAMIEAKLSSTVASFSFPGEDKTGMKTVSLSQTALPKKLNEAMGALVKAMGEQDSKAFTMSMDYKAAAEKYKQHEIDLVTMKFKVKDAESAEGMLMDAMFRKIFGGDGLQERITTLDKLSIQATGNDSKFLERVLEGIDSGKDVAGLDKAFGKTRDALGKDANLLMMINAPQMVLDVVGMLKDVPLIGEGLKLAPFNFSLKPPASFGGFSFSTDSHGLRLKAFVPVEQPKAMLQIFAPGT